VSPCESVRLDAQSIAHMKGWPVIPPLTTVSISDARQLARNQPIRKAAN
jgi:hypothetical protein